MTGLRSIAKRLLGLGTGGDYREALFADLRVYLAGTKARRALEIGPKDGQHTRRLFELAPERLTLVDLPRMRKANERWRRELDAGCIEYVSGNIMYGPLAQSLRSSCHKHVSAALARAWAAYPATKPPAPKRSTYYDMAGDEGFEVGPAR